MLFTPMLSLLLTCIVLISIPGPSILYIVGQALAQGKKAALLSVLGNAVGTTVIAILIASVIGPILISSSAARFALTSLGAVTLVMIGFRHVTSSNTAAVKTPHCTAGVSNKSFYTGVIVGATNPKALVIFGTVVPSFYSLDGGLPPILKLLLLSSIPILTGLLIDSLWALLADKLGAFLKKSPLALRYMNACGGFFILIMAFMLILEAYGNVKAHII
uniref:LysE family translocator n=1 Tax=Scandinavium goeteborgense TaxID=1851514 RepID=UPI0013589E38|nr:LysE family translocator [Scandinavium goeteborgense]